MKTDPPAPSWFLMCKKMTNGALVSEEEKCFLITVGAAAHLGDLVTGRLICGTDTYFYLSQVLSQVLYLAPCSCVGPGDIFIAEK